MGKVNAEVDENDYAVAFEIISYAGEARSYAADAVKLAGQGKFEEAASSIDKAEESMAQAHNCLFGLVTDEAQGKKAELNIILVHAQDHLAMAAMAEEQAKLAYDLYHRIAGLEEKKGVKK